MFAIRSIPAEYPARQRVVLNADVSTVKTLAAPIPGARMAQTTGGGSRLDRLLKLLECACASAECCLAVSHSSPRLSGLLQRVQHRQHGPAPRRPSARLAAHTRRSCRRSCAECVGPRGSHNAQLGRQHTSAATLSDSPSPSLCAAASAAGQPQVGDPSCCWRGCRCSNGAHTARKREPRRRCRHVSRAMLLPTRRAGWQL